MNQVKTADVRNVVLIGHEATGKTMMLEACMKTMGEINRMGTIDEGNTLSDYTKAEIDRKKSISMVLAQGFHNNRKINLIDTPGFSDFMGEVMTGVQTADAAAVVVAAHNGVEVGTSFYSELALKQNMPLVFVINHMDREHAKFDETIEQLKETFGSGVLPLHIPLNATTEDFDQVIDLDKMKLVSFAKDESGSYTEADLAGEQLEQANEMLESLMESVAESDDALLEKFFEEGELTQDEFRQGLAKGIKSGKIFPVLTSIATLNRGTARLLDVIAEYLPSPLDVEGVTLLKDGEETTQAISEDNPAAVQIFKTVVEKHVGELSFFRIFGGKMTPGMDLRNNSADNAQVKFGQLYRTVGHSRHDVTELVAGDLGVTVKLKNVHSGDTIADKGCSGEYAKVKYPNPVHDVAIIAKVEGEEEKISQGLTALQVEDPSFTINHSMELHQTILSGQGELQLDIVVEKLRNRFNVEAELVEPRIPYRETITGKADEKYRHKKQSGGAGQFAEVWMRVEPLPRGEDFEFVSEVVGGAISSSFIPAIEKGVKQVMEQGVVTGNRVIDVKCIVYDGKEHPVDSKDIAFQIAGREVFKTAIKNSNPIVLEPIYSIEVKVPEEYMGDVMGDISSRRGKIQGMDAEGRYQIIRAKVPLADLYRYATHLRSMTQGRGLFSRDFSHYEKMPPDLQRKIMTEYEASLHE